MARTESGQSLLTNQGRTEAERRATRRAAALRQNLRRRKEQERQRVEPVADPVKQDR